MDGGMEDGGGHGGEWEHWDGREMGTDGGLGGMWGMEGDVGTWRGAAWRGVFAGDVVIRGVVGLSSPPGGSRGAGRNCGAQEEFWCFLQRRFSLFFPHFWVGKGPHSAREPLLGTTSPIMHRGWGGGRGGCPHDHEVQHGKCSPEMEMGGVTSTWSDPPPTSHKPPMHRRMEGWKRGGRGRDGGWKDGEMEEGGKGEGWRDGGRLEGWKRDGRVEEDGGMEEEGRGRDGGWKRDGGRMGRWKRDG